MGGRVQGMAGITVALAQFGAGEDKRDNLHRIQADAQKAKDFGASMLIFPEYSMFYAKVNRRSKNIQAAEPLDGPFVSTLSQVARQHGLWIAAGMYEQTNALPYNTIVVMDADGMLRGVHRKQRLYDAFGYRESDECRAGEKPFQPVDTPVGRLGLITCYELRFPALAAAQKQDGAEVLLVPAGWTVGANKVLHWRTLLCARAIENNMMVFGVDQYIPDCFIGHSAAFAADGRTLGALEEGNGLLTITMDKENYDAI